MIYWNFDLLCQLVCLALKIFGMSLIHVTLIALELFVSECKDLCNLQL